jgi:hypothetical protein
MKPDNEVLSRFTSKLAELSARNIGAAIESRNRGSSNRFMVQVRHKSSPIGPKYK